MLEHLTQTMRDRPAEAGVALFALCAALTLGGAWSLQLFWHMYPCPLCLEQRQPWYIGGALALVLLALPFASPTWGRRAQFWSLPLLAFITAYGVWRAAFHVGVEQHWWTYVCTGGRGTLTLDDLNENAFTAEAVPCDAVQFEFLGISLAGYNFLLSGGLIVALLYFFWRANMKRTAS